MRIICSAFVTFFILICTVGPSNFSYNLLQKYVIGGMKNTSILVERDECTFLNKKSSINICHKEGDLYIVDNVILLWRAGEYFIRPLKNQSQSFILPYRGGKVVFLNSVNSK